MNSLFYTICATLSKCELSTYSFRPPNKVVIRLKTVIQLYYISFHHALNIEKL